MPDTRPSHTSSGGRLRSPAPSGRRAARGSPHGPSSPWPRLHAIVDAGSAARAGRTPVELARAYLDGGARLVQLRAPGVDTRTLVDWARAIVVLAAARGARVVVNDRCDVALMADAHGAHVGQDDLPARAARRLLGPDAVLGLSTHDAPQLESALRQPVSYLAVGPVHDTRTKDTGYAAVGLEAVRRAAGAAGARPVVAIGGVTLETAPALVAAGAASVAVISDLLAGGDPVRRVRAYVDLLEDDG